MVARPRRTARARAPAAGWQPGPPHPSGGRRGANGRLMPYFEHAPNLRTKEMPAMADQVTTAKSIVERLLDPKVQDEVTKRGRALMAAIGEAAETASERAATGWRDAEPIRQDAARAGRDALRWGSRTWQQGSASRPQPPLEQANGALGAAGAAVPVARELIDDAAVRMGHSRPPRAAPLGQLLRRAADRRGRRPDRRRPDRPEGWSRDARRAGGDRQGCGDARPRGRFARRREVATRAREAAASAGEWVPIFQRPEIDGDAERRAQSVERSRCRRRV